MPDHRASTGQATAVDVRIGSSGWTYRHWRKDFYPHGLVQRHELRYLSERMNSTEINSSFYALQRPTSYLAWREQTPEDFAFAVKGSRFITHMLKLRNCEQALANFLASGILALGPKLGPILWQLPPFLAYDESRLSSFFDLLPRTTSHAAMIGQGHDDRLTDRSWTTTEQDRPIRHVMEARHGSFLTPGYPELLRRHDIGLVVADTAGTFPWFDDVTSGLVYARLHGHNSLYVGGYPDESLDWWAGRVQGWTEAGCDVSVYFDNDAHGHAPYDAVRLQHRVDLRLR